MVMIANFSVRTDSDFYGPRAMAAQNVTFPTDFVLNLGEPTVEFKLTMHLDSPTKYSITKLWSRTNTHSYIEILIPETSWPQDLPEITTMSGTESFGIIIMGAFIYNGTFYNTAIEHTNISDNFYLYGYTFTVKRCGDFGVFLPKFMSQQAIVPSPYRSGPYYQWSASPQVEFQHFFLSAADSDAWVVSLTQQGTYTFFVKEFPSFGYSVPEPILPVNPISVKNLATDQIFNMTFFDRITTNDGEISLYRSSDNSLIIGLGLLAIFLVRVPAIYAWGDSKWNNQRIDIMTKAHIVNMICQDVPVGTDYIYLDDDNIAQTGNIQTGDEVFKTCWFRHSLSTEFDQYVTSEGVLSTDHRFADASGQEFNSAPASMASTLYISTNTPQDIYWSYRSKK